MCVSLSSRGRSGWVHLHELFQWGGYKCIHVGVAVLSVLEMQESATENVVRKSGPVHSACCLVQSTATVHAIRSAYTHTYVHTCDVQ